jgi:hypothetical protein
VTSTVWLERGVRFAVSEASREPFCIFIDSGDFSIAVADEDSAQELISALLIAVDRLKSSAPEWL